jgi:hypothetical protein
MFFNTGLRLMSNRLPKVISPRGHAVLDYATAGLFLVAGALLWRRNKRASVAAFAVAADEVAISLLTDYPGGVRPILSFETHGKIDAALAPFVAALPNILDFEDDPGAANLFRGGAVMTAAITGMTDFKDERKGGRGRRAA